MGVGPFHKSSFSSYDAPAPRTSQPSQNPNPARFEIIRQENYGKWCVAEVRYPDATNYEGHKIMVLPTSTVEKAVKINGGTLDPHFSNSPSHVAPVARFEPTRRGWTMALGVAEYLKGQYL